jgi:asparagine synthase (glutamine-hydrolysing)
MCGITGIVSFKETHVDKRILEKMTCSLAHRGPDAENMYIDGNMGLGHRRLSIIDLSDAANQPFAENTGRFVIVFNGEIYNFREIRSKLIDYRFRTSSDTEVLVAAYAQWGIKCLDYIDGMFAFAIWDKHEKELIVVRDRMGVKPLYYAYDSRCFIFSSEIRSLLQSDLICRKINLDGIYDFFSYQSIGCTLSPVENVVQLEAGYYLQLRDGLLTKKRYWNILLREPDRPSETKEQVKGKIKELVTGSIQKRMVSDVPVGAFLSGGIDSSLIVAVMSTISSERPSTFTVTFGEEAFDESKYAAIVSKKFNTRHTNILLKPDTVLHELEGALSVMDIPSGDGVNSYVVSKSIKDAGISVALSGIGGDELFAGYAIFEAYKRLNRFRPFFRVPGALRRYAVTFPYGTSSSRSGRLMQLISAPSATI